MRCALPSPSLSCHPAYLADYFIASCTNVTPRIWDFAVKVARNIFGFNVYLCRSVKPFSSIVGLMVCKSLRPLARSFVPS